tara:strand:- start:1419 stop:1760 length:342 start_codon:yes stop_codon:yes gene_type:complete
MGMMSFVLAIIAILIAGAALGIQLTSTDFDPGQCNVVYGNSATIQTQTCDQLCNQNQCLFGLRKFYESSSTQDHPLELVSQESIISCDEELRVGSFPEPDGSESYSLGCVCCG